MAKCGRPPVPIEEAREFGRLVNASASRAKNSKRCSSGSIGATPGAGDRSARCGGCGGQFRADPAQASQPEEMRWLPAEITWDMQFRNGIKILAH